MAAETTHTSFVDSIWMRLIAAFVVIGGLLLFVAANEDFLAESLSNRSGGEPTPYQACLNERMDAVEALAEEAGYTVKQRELAVIRAEEYCRNQTGT